MNIQDWAELHGYHTGMTHPDDDPLFKQKLEEQAEKLTKELGKRKVIREGWQTKQEWEAYKRETDDIANLLLETERQIEQL